MHGMWATVVSRSESGRTATWTACGSSAGSGRVAVRENLLVKEKLGSEEREILDRFEQGELRPVVDVEHELGVARQAARNTFNKTRRVNSGRPVEKVPTDR